MRELTNRQKAFIEHYLVCWNASEAARRAGYTGDANTVGPRLLAHVGIQSEIQARLTELKMSANEVLVKLTEQARGSIEDFGDVGKLGTFQMDMNKAKRLGRLSNVKKLKPNKYGYELELYDAQAALDKLGRAHGLYKERGDYNINLEGTVKTIAFVERAAGGDAPGSDEVPSE